MAIPLLSLSDLRAGLTLTEINQKLPLHLINNKDFQDLTEKFLISQATAYPLPTSCRNAIQSLGVSLSSECKPCKDNVESVMGEKLPFEALRPAEKPTLDERLRTCDTLIRSQARELTQLQQTLRDGKDDSVLLSQHLKDLLTHSDLDNHQGQGFRESLLEGHWLAEHLAYKLSPGEGATDPESTDPLLDNQNDHEQANGQDLTFPRLSAFSFLMYSELIQVE
ncbi:hypothetical protein G4228_013271 [Cervus hanglu yarkandensis]|nr:hypothetical protein G4228_013271 [Cervus hanglu yarkandensis]